MESIGRDNIKLSEKAIEDLISMLDKEQILQAEQKIEKAIAKSMKEAEKLKNEVEKSDKDLAKLVTDIHDSAKEIQDIAHELGANDATSDKLADKAKPLKAEVSKGFAFSDLRSYILLYFSARVQGHGQNAEGQRPRHERDSAESCAGGQESRSEEQTATKGLGWQRSKRKVRWRWWWLRCYSRRQHRDRSSPAGGS